MWYPASLMQATLFEFRHRWWVIFFIFFAAFLAYSLDPVNCGLAIVNWVAKHLGFTATENAYRLILAFSALLLTLAALLRTWGTSYLQADVMRDSKIHTERCWPTALTGMSAILSILATFSWRRGWG